MTGSSRGLDPLDPSCIKIGHGLVFVNSFGRLDRPGRRPVPMGKVLAPRLNRSRTGGNGRRGDHSGDARHTKKKSIKPEGHTISLFLKH